MIFAIASMTLLTSAKNADGADAVTFINALPHRQITEYGATGLLRIDDGVEPFIALAAQFGITELADYQGVEPSDQGVAEIAEAIQAGAVLIDDPWLGWPAFRTQVLGEVQEAPGP